MNLIVLQKIFFLIKTFKKKFDSSQRDNWSNKAHVLYINLTQSTRTVTWLPLFNASLENVE